MTYELDRNEQVTLQDAIDRSQSHNEITRLDWDSAAIDAAVDWIKAIYDGDVDYVESGEVTEIWGWTDEQAEGEMDFRIHLRAAPNLAA